MSRVHEEFLDRQQQLTQRSIARATRNVGAELETIVDVKGLIRRRPALALGAGAVGGFFAGTLLKPRSRGVARSAFRSVVVPLFRPTINALGTTLAGVLVGSPPEPRD